MKEKNPVWWVVYQTLKHWHGNGRLWSAFWVFGVALKIIIIYLGGMVYVLFYGYPVGGNISYELSSLFGVIFIAVNCIHALASVVMVWRCSKNTKYEPFTALAKVVVFLFVLSVLYSLYVQVAE